MTAVKSIPRRYCFLLLYANRVTYTTHTTHIIAQQGEFTKICRKHYESEGKPTKCTLPLHSSSPLASSFRPFSILSRLSTPKQDGSGNSTALCMVVSLTCKLTTAYVILLLRVIIVAFVPFGRRRWYYYCINQWHITAAARHATRKVLSGNILLR